MDIAAMPAVMSSTTLLVADVMSSPRIASERTERSKSGHSAGAAGLVVERVPPGVPGAPTSRSRTCSSQSSTKLFRSKEPSKRSLGASGGEVDTWELSSAACETGSGDTRHRASAQQGSGIGEPSAKEAGLPLATMRSPESRRLGPGSESRRVASRPDRDQQPAECYYISTIRAQRPCLWDSAACVAPRLHVQAGQPRQPRGRSSLGGVAAASSRGAPSR
eukprot:scaffold49326_cov29-Tisochrysis_lutea.AAC.3